MSQTIVNDPRSSMPWASCTVQVGTTRRPSSTHGRQRRDYCTSFHHGLHGSVGMVNYAHVSMMIESVYYHAYFSFIGVGPLFRYRPGTRGGRVFRFRPTSSRKRETIFPCPMVASSVSHLKTWECVNTDRRRGI